MAGDPHSKRWQAERRFTQMLGSPPAQYAQVDTTDLDVGNDPGAGFLSAARTRSNRSERIARAPQIAAYSEAVEQGRWVLGFRPFMQMSCRHIAGSEKSGGVTSLDAVTIDARLFAQLGPRVGDGAGAANEREPGADHLDEAYLSPPAVRELMAVGFDDGSVVVFKEETTAFSAHGLKDPGAFSYYSTLINSSLLRRKERKPVKSVAIALSGEYVVVTYVGGPFACEFELISRRTRWEETRRIVPSETGNGGVANSLQDARYSPDSQLVAIACGDEAHGGAVYLWSRHTDEVSMVCRVNQAVLTIRFTAPSVHGRERIVTGAADGILRAFEQTEGGKRFHLMWQNAGHHKRVTEIAVSTSGRAIVSCSADGNAQIISAVDGNGGNSISRTLDHDVTQRHGITGARFRTDAGSTSFATCSEDRRVRVFDRDSGMLLAESVATAEPLRALCYVAGGSAVVAGGSDGTLHFFDVSMPESYESAQNESALTCAVVDPFGELVVTGDRDDVKFYDSFTGVFLARQVVDCEVLSLAFCAVGDPVPIMTSPTAAAANSVSDDAVDADARDNPPNHMIYVRTGVLVAVCASEHGSRRTGSASGKIMIFKFDFQSHDGGYHTQGDLTFESAIKVALPGQHIAVVAHPSRPQFVVCTKMLGGAGTADFSNIALFDAIDGRRLWQSELTAVPVQSICFSPPGDAVVAATCDARLLLIRVSDGALVAGSPHRRGKKPAEPWEFNFLPPSVRQGAIQHGWEGVRRVLLAWAPTTTASAGNSLVAVAHSRPWLRPVSNGTGKFDDLVGWTRPDVHTVAVYNFGGTASVGGCTVQLAYSLVRHPEAIEACDFSTDGALLCTGCRDGFLRIFDSRQGHQLYCSLDHSGRVLTAQFFTYHDGDIGVITSSARGTWRLFLYDDYVRSTVALCTNLALQPAVSPMSLQVLQRAFCLFGRYAMAMNAKSCGGVFDLLFSRIPDGPDSFTFGLSQHSVPVMLRRERVCPAVVQIVRAWPYSTAADINLANGRGGRLRTAVDVILDMGKSSEAAFALIAVVLHLNHAAIDTDDPNADHSPFWALARTIPKLLRKYPDLAALVLDMDLEDTTGCEHVQWTDDNEHHMDRVVVLQTNSPLWTWRNEWKWRYMVLQPDIQGLAHRVRAEELSTIDFSKYGVEPKIIPLPAPHLLWNAVTATARMHPALGELFFATRTMAAITEHKWATIRKQFIAVVSFYGMYLLATTYTSVVYARNEGIPESALWSPDTPFLDIGLVVSLVLDGGFLVLCCLKLYVGTHSLWLSALGWLPHIFHLIAVAQRNENANPHIQATLFALAIMFAWLKGATYGRATRAWGTIPFMFSIFISKVLPHLVGLLVILGGFGFGFMALHSSTYAPYKNFWQATTSLAMLMFGNFPEAVVRRGNDTVSEFFEGTEFLTESDYAYYTQFILVFVFVFLTAMFVLNVLIAILSLEYEKLDKGERWRFERAMLIHELQSYKYLLLLFGVSESKRLDLIDENTLARMALSDVPKMTMWMHVMPPDDQPFWHTQMEPLRDAAETYSSLTELERDVRRVLLQPLPVRI